MFQQPQTVPQFPNLFMCLHIYFLPPLAPNTAVTKTRERRMGEGNWGLVEKNHWISKETEENF